MKVAVRYYSRSGNTKLLAEAIAKGTGVNAISVDNDDSKIDENVDILFIGGALYAYGLDKNLNKYLSEIDGEKIGKAVVFSTSWLSKHSIDLIKKVLKSKNIEVEEDYIYAKSKPTETFLRETEELAKKFVC